MLSLSLEASEDLRKFLLYLKREYRREYLDKKASVVDLGCGNGRNSIFISRTYGSRVSGIDSGEEAIAQAKRASGNLQTQFRVGSLADPLPYADSSQDLVLDMMVSHFLLAKQRGALLGEIVRILKSGAWLFYKTFLLEDDAHAARLLRNYPADEPGSYIHPTIGALEHVFTEDEIIESLSPFFTIRKILKSHRHRDRFGRPHKRRSISVYAQKKPHTRSALIPTI